MSNRTIWAFGAFVVMWPLAGCQNPAAKPQRFLGPVYHGSTADGSRQLAIEYQVQTVKSSVDRKLMVSLLPGPAKGDAPATAAVRPRVWTIQLSRDSFQPSAPANLEGRWDGASDRMWLVDIQTQRVWIAVDPVSSIAFGPEDAMPNWADLRGGSRLTPG